MEKETKTIIFNLKSSWDDITIKEHFEIRDISNSLMLKDIEKSNNIVSILSGVDLDIIESIPFRDMIKVFEKTKFLNDKIHIIKVPDSIIISGLTFLINKEISKMTATEYIDFCELAKDGEKNIHIILSLFIKPAEYKKTFYGKKLIPIKNYDLEEHQKFIYNNLNIVLAQSLMIFFSKVLKNLIDYTKTYLELKIKRITMREKLRMKLGLKPKINTVGLDLLIESQKKLTELMTMYMN